MASWLPVNVTLPSWFSLVNVTVIPDIPLCLDVVLRHFPGLFDVPHKLRWAVLPNLPQVLFLNRQSRLNAIPNDAAAGAASST